MRIHIPEPHPHRPCSRCPGPERASRNPSPLPRPLSRATTALPPRAGEESLHPVPLVSPLSRSGWKGAGRTGEGGQGGEGFAHVVLQTCASPYSPGGLNEPHPLTSPAGVGAQGLEKCSPAGRHFLRRGALHESARLHLFSWRRRRGATAHRPRHRTPAVRARTQGRPRADLLGARAVARHRQLPGRNPASLPGRHRRLHPLVATWNAPARAPHASGRQPLRLRHRVRARERDAFLPGKGDPRPPRLPQDDPAAHRIGFGGARDGAVGAEEGPRRLSQDVVPGRRGLVHSRVPCLRYVRPVRGAAGGAPPPSDRRPPAPAAVRRAGPRPAAVAARLAVPRSAELRDGARSCLLRPHLPGRRRAERPAPASGGRQAVPPRHGHERLRQIVPRARRCAAGADLSQRHRGDRLLALRELRAGQQLQ